MNGCEVAGHCVLDPRCGNYADTCEGMQADPPPVDTDKIEYGPIELSVRSEVVRLGEGIERPGKRVLAEMAFKLARALDVRGDEESPSQTAKAIDTLRITMGQLLQGDDHDPNEQRDLATILGSPSSGGSPVSAEIRYPKKSRAADPGPGGREDRDGDGQAADAAPAIHLGCGAGD